MSAMYEPDKLWQQFDKEALAVQYSPSSCVDNFDELIANYTGESMVCEQNCTVQKDLRYGGEDELLDFFPAGDPNGPLMIFIHGGYWQALSKNDSTFPAASFVERGVSFAAVDYTIAPEGQIEQMIDQCVRSVSWLAENASRLGFSPDKIYLSGSSAGAHLVVMTLLGLEQAGAVSIRKCILMSGVYNVIPLVHTYVNEPLGLTENRARELSPICHDLSGLPEALICYGENETPEFKRQSEEFAGVYQKAGCQCTTREIPDCNHFDIVHQLGSLWRA